jgi:hypothetical protein
MDTWHKFLLQDINIFQATVNLQLEFKVFFDSASDDNVKGATLLSKFHRNGAMVYFSPKASKIAKPLIEKYKALPCSIPSSKQDDDGYLLSLLAGDQLFFIENFPPEKNIFG